jgi:hypothetical protein
MIGARHSKYKNVFAQPVREIITGFQLSSISSENPQIKSNGKFTAVLTQHHLSYDLI